MYSDPTLIVNWLWEVLGIFEFNLVERIECLKKLKYSGVAQEQILQVMTLVLSVWSFAAVFIDRGWHKHKD